MPSTPWFCLHCDTAVPLPHLCPHQVKLVRGDFVQRRSAWPGQLYFELTSAILAAVQEAIDELMSGEHASSSRDFGRGVAHATRTIAGAVAAAIEINVNDLTVPED